MKILEFLTRLYITFALLLALALTLGLPFLALYYILVGW